MPHLDSEDWIATHEALKNSPHWDNLALDGIQSGGGVMLVEQRRCPDCGSTLSRPVDVARASQLVSRLGELLSVSVDALAIAVRALTAPPPERRRRSNKSAAVVEPKLPAVIESRRAA